MGTITGLKYVVKTEKENENGGERQSANWPGYGHCRALWTDTHEFG